MKTKQKILQAIKDSTKFVAHLKSKYEDKNGIHFTGSPESIKYLVVRTEICTLNWVLGKGSLNCYAKRKRDRNESK